MTTAPADDSSSTDTDANVAEPPPGETDEWTAHSNEHACGDPDGGAGDTASRDGLGEFGRGDTGPHVLLFWEPNRNRRLLADFLATEMTVTASNDVDALDEDVDLCLIDRRGLDRHHDAVTERRAELDPVFLPVVLVDSSGSHLNERVWAVVDEIVQTPISKPILLARLRNLLARRQQTCRLAEREAELEVALTELRVRDRAMAEAPIGVTIAGRREDDTPLVYVNDAFCELTGYDRSEILGQNCRFLQGPRTDEATVAELRAALDAARPISVDLVNYTRTDEQFWNKVDIAPVRDDSGEVTHFIGFQTDITGRKLHEQRVDVLNRFMRHNLRNELNIIDGYRDALTRDVGVDREVALERIGDAIGRLVGLSEETSHIEQVFSGRPTRRDIQPITTVIDNIDAGVRRRHPDVTVHVERPDEPVAVSARVLALGCVDYLAMLLDTNGCETDSKAVSVVARVDDDVVDIALSDSCGGLNDIDWHVVERGVETPLRHIDHLGLWVLRWVTTTNGGDLVRADDGTLHARFQIRQPPATDE